MFSYTIKSVINEKLQAFGYSRKGTSWFKDTNELIKVVNLQKSNFAKSYYINYGFNIKGLDMQGVTMHIQNRYGSVVAIDNNRIKETLNLESEMEDSVRKKKIEQIMDDVIHLLSKIDTVNDLVGHLQGRSHMNDIPLVVKKHLLLSQ